YSLQIGTGYNPQQWTSLISNGLNQFTEEDIFTLDLSSMDENVYTLRLVVVKNDGGTLEERTHFHIMRNPPKVTEIALGPLYYGDRSTINGEFLTNHPSIMRLYYRRFGEGNFNFVTLDGFSTNNQIVKTRHYGFIPKDLVQPNTLYEDYFEAENLAGLKTVVVDSANGNDYFRIPTEKVPQPIPHNLMPFSLMNSATLFRQPVNFYSDNNEVIVHPFVSGNEPIFFHNILENDEFLKVSPDTLQSRFPLLYGDFNNNGLKDLIALNFEQIFSLEQTQINSFSFNERDLSNRLYYPITITDLLNNGTHYLITENDTITKVAGRDS